MRIRYLFLFLTLSLIGCNRISSVKRIKLGHGLDVNHSVHQAFLKMSKDLEELSGGKMKLEVYANQQLGTERECLELLQIGSLEMTKVSSGVLENFAPKMKVFGMPFIFRDKAHAFQVQDSEIGQMILNDGSKYWLKGLAFFDSGSRSFYTKEKPIYKPEDLQGLKIRVMESVTAMDMVNTMGGSPTPISWGELYTSLQQGVVDGAENNPPSFYLSHHYEVCKYYTLDEHTILPDVVLISTHFWNSLSEEEQNWMQQAVDKAVVYQRKLWEESEAHALEEVEKAGVEIIRPDKSLFSKAVEKIYDQSKSDPELYELIMKIQNKKN